MCEVKKVAHPTRWVVIKTDLATSKIRTIEGMKTWADCGKWIERDAREDRENGI